MADIRQGRLLGNTIAAQAVSDEASRLVSQSIEQTLALFGQDQLDVAQAKAEDVILPDGMADDLRCRVMSCSPMACNAYPSSTAKRTLL
jgi:hypothetical protein